MTPVRLEPAAPRSRVKHSTTEPLRSLNSQRSVLMHGVALPPVIVLLNTLADIKLRKFSYFGYMNTIITLCTSVDPDLEASPEAS